MSLASRSLEYVLAMNAAQRTTYFNRFASFFKDSPGKRYAIRVGSTTLHADDTMELRTLFDMLLARADPARAATKVLVA
jgi:hypothetical protein